MNWLATLKLLAMIIGIVILGFAVASLVDIAIAVFGSRFYTEVAFVITFIVVGIFATSIAYIRISESPQYSPIKAQNAIIGLIICLGLLFFFLFAQIEGGEYEVAIKGYGASLSLSTSLFFKKENRAKMK